MFVRGSGSGNEYRRVDNSFYRGIIVKNNDPEKLNRVKIYIPELTNQPYDEWFEKFEIFILKSPGVNSNPKTESEKKKTGDWEDYEIFDEICKGIPWAEPCFPLFGESNNFRLNRNLEDISTISDCNYEDGFRIIDKDAPTIQDGSFSPAFLYENEETVIGDSFSSPTVNFCVKCNPYSFSYRPSKHVNKTKGVIGIPEVGSKVWVFHYEGDLNFPVYFGVTQDFRSLTLLNDTDNESKIGPVYPNDFEN
jgi:hypothetical protein